MFTNPSHALAPRGLAALAVLAQVSLMGCGGDTVATVNSRTVQIAGCNEDGGAICWTRMVVAVPVVEVTQATGRNSASLTAEGLDASDLAAAPLTPELATDDCKGGCDLEVTLSWEQNGVEYEAVYEEGSRPAALAEAEDFALALSDAVKSCDEASAWVVLDEGCSPLED